MKMKNRITGAVMAVSTLFALSGFAQQLKIPAPSPAQMLKQSFGLGEITIDYSRPGVKGRTIFGDVVPFGKIWRTGANATTKVTFSDDVKLEGKPVVAGTYGLYTVPNKESWDIMLYKDLTLGGNVSEYKPENEILRFKVKPLTSGQKVETFTITVAEVSPSSAKIELAWDKTIVPITVSTDIDGKILKNIEQSLSPDDKRPYFQAATYYYENDKDMTKALEWANKAIEQNKAFYTVHLKAKIQMKLKDYKGATETAEQSMALAKEAQNDDYVRMNEKIIAEAKKSK